jgi:hypothetical protein
MEQINFRDWRLRAAIIDSDILKLDIETVDGSDIVDLGVPGVPREGEQYSLHLSTQKLEEAHQQSRRAAGRDGGESDEDEPSGWLADEDESIYLRGWEVDALVDEDGLLTVTVERGDAEIYEAEPFESSEPLSSHIVLRLAAEETGEDEDEEEHEEEEEPEDEYEELDQLDELDEDYEDTLEDNVDFDDDEVFEEDEDEY